MGKTHVELLAPAGNRECLHAAVTAGADAVYLGAETFNARRSADNFTLETLSEACDYAHLRGVRIYLTVNTILLPSEFRDAIELVRQAYRCGVDAFIVQDIGLASELSRVLPEARLHISTQMNTHSEDGILAAAALGAQRVTLARELSLDEVARLSAFAAQRNIQTESFAHGALCICYSGQCFMSSMIGGRSANRGRCAQACRLPYTLRNSALRKDLPAPGEHLLSPKDMCTIDILPELIGTGVSSLKIEGRMKSPEYVTAAVSVYRAVIDRACAFLDETAAEGSSAINPRPTEEETGVLSEAFSRGFTSAYLTGHRGNDIMSYGRPNNRGVALGRVSSLHGGKVWVNASQPIHTGDVVEFWTNRGHFAHTVTDFSREGTDLYGFTVDKSVGKGDRVFRVRNAEAAFCDDEHEPRIPLNGSVSLHIGSPLRLTLSTCASNDDEVKSVTVEGSIVEAARTKAVTAEDVRDHIDRMGSTPFRLNDFDVDLDEGVGIGFSALHKIRSEAADRLADEIVAPWHGRTLDKTPAREYSRVVHERGCSVCVTASNPACARAAKRAGADVIYVPALNFRRGEAVIAGQLSGTAEQAGYPKKALIIMPTVSHDGDADRPDGFDVWANVKPEKPVMVQNLGQLVRASMMGAQPQVGPYIPITNREDLETAAELGATEAWLSPELSLVQIQELGENTPLPLGLTIQGSQELMITEHCLLMSQGPCEENCADCPRRKSPHYLKDRKGYETTVITDAFGRSHLYNAVPLDIADKLPDLIQAGISRVMVDTTLMNVAETTEAVKRAVRARDIALKTGDRVSRKQDTTSGHLFRGVE